MPRNYIKKAGAEGKRNYNENYLHEAVKKVKSGEMSIRKASECFAVPYTTVQRWVKGGDKLLKYGRQSVLSPNEENCLVQALILCANWGFPLQSTDIRNIVQQYLNKKGVVEKRFKDNRPGLEWFQCFIKRHPELTVKFAQNIKRSRAAVTRESLQAYFTNLEQSLEGVPPSHIINYDETNFSDDPGSVKVVVRRGMKHPERIIDSSKASTSVMIAATGDGHILPPYVVYKAKHLYPGWTEGGIDGAAYNRNLSGWFDASLFQDWFSTIILPYCRRMDGTKLLIGDNLSSHLTLDVIQECEQNNIRFVLLPPNATHLCQPLDVAFFRPMKGAWRKVLDEWKTKNRGTLPKTEFPRILKKTFEHINSTSSQNAKSGFKSCGIVPFNPTKVLAKLPETDSSSTEDMQQLWAHSVIEHLKEVRSSETAKSTAGISRRAGKRMNIEPGRSVVGRDLTNHLAEERIDDPDSESEPPENNDEICDSETNPAIEIHCNEGDLVLVSFSTNKRDRFFVGKIEEEKEDNNFVVNFLRKKQSKKGDYFVYPDVPDIQTVSKSSILTKVGVRDIRRGRYIVLGIDIHNIE